MLQALKFFYEFWHQKYGFTFCYSFHASSYDPSIAIDEMPNFFQYLENGRSSSPNILPLPLSTAANQRTASVRVHAVAKFIAFLISTYISPAYQDGSPKEQARLATRLYTQLSLRKDGYRMLTSTFQKRNANFKSMTVEMVTSVYKIITPCSSGNLNVLNPFPYGRIQLRNFLIVRLLLNYGLRVGELLLLECCSIKQNVQGDKYSLIITTVNNKIDIRKHAPSLKNIYANRVLELDKHDYNLLMIYINRIRKNDSSHDFIFTSSQKNGKPLSYSAVHTLFAKLDFILKRNHPEFCDPGCYDSLPRLTPHTARHTWAYLTLKKIYRQKTLNYRSIPAMSSLDSNLMAEAKDELRIIAGWSMNSKMPDLYAKRFISEQANAANLQRIAEENATHKDIVNYIVEMSNDL
ncbi:site-specific integrase [Salmonella enterica subsp. arizonae]|uniref:Site-specific integrase n=1 Tax=Salmonella enteritidis TaxID=149539 RepID=A0A3R0QAJ9_SALEN|nr:site-specific integrase [Salmonella enterica subsp. diarizonae]EED4924646.1 site-specific integrase [Salmonella enterica subsp. arizonae]MJY19817.1 site-specific integrase [Salmonella enterica subsp. enterica serovar Enteritidis]